MKKFAWYNLYQKSKTPTWKEGDSIYFRFTPYLVDWVTLIIMSTLNLINKLFVDKEIVQEMDDAAYKAIRETYS